METNTILVSPEVKTKIPDVLIEYLCKLALAEECRQDSIQTFVLTPGELGGRHIQNILHADRLRRVFGIEPIHCKLLVFSCANQYQMALDI